VGSQSGRSPTTHESKQVGVSLISFVRILDSKEFARVSSLVLANDSEPDDGTPGFGAVVALIVLVPPCWPSAIRTESDVLMPASLHRGVTDRRPRSTGV